MNGVTLAVVAYLATVALIAVCGRLGLPRLQAALANFTIIIPANVVITLLFVVLTPVRWIYYRWLNMKVTTIVSLYTIRPRFWEADWDKLLDSFPVGYWAILDGLDILSLSPIEAQEQLRDRANNFPFPQMRSCISAVLPAWVMKSLLFRLGCLIIITPLLAWWLIGFTYIPTLPVWSPAPSQQEEHTEGEETPPGHTVVMQIPECKFLIKAREKYGTEKGNLACVNE